MITVTGAVGHSPSTSRPAAMSAKLMSSKGRRPIEFSQNMAGMLPTRKNRLTAPVTVIILAFGLYAFFSGGPGILQWLYPNELFPTEVRATAVGVAIGFSRIGTIAATYGTPLALDAWGVGPVMLVAAGLVLLGLVLSYFLAPETRGKSLAETSGIDDR